MFRTTFDHNAAVVLSAFMRCGGQCLEDFSSTVRGKALRGGSITGLHTHGRHGPYHPHLPLLATSGGYDAQGARWEHLQSVPYALRRRTWQGHVLTMLPQTLKPDAVHRWVDGCVRQYPDGLVTNVQKGAVPAPYPSVARDVAKDGVSPPIAVRRIDHSDGERVTDHDRSHRTDRMEHGRCFRAVDSISDEEPKFIAIDEEADHQIVHGCRFRKADRAAYETLDPGAQIDVLAFDFLRIFFANRVLLGIDMALVGPPPVGVKSRDTEWL